MLVLFKLDDFFFGHESARQTDRCLNCLGSGVRKDDALDAGNDVDQLLGQIDLTKVLGSESVGLRKLIGVRLSQTWMVVPDTQRPPPQGIIDEPIAIDVEKLETLATFKIHRHGCHILAKNSRKTRREGLTSALIKNRGLFVFHHWSL